MNKITTMKVYKADVKLARRIIADLGCNSMKDLFHKFVQSYYVIMLLDPKEGVETVEVTIEVDSNE